MYLDFEMLDDLTLAIGRKSVDARSHLSQATVNRLGPLTELVVLGRAKEYHSMSPDCLPHSALKEALIRALLETRRASSAHGNSNHSRFGFIATSRDPNAEDQTEWVAFCRKAQEAAETAGLPKTEAQQLVGALREMEENVHLHSARPDDGLVGYSATAEAFEFVVADSGIGVLRSLQSCPAYSDLRDGGTAIKIALSDGASRFGSSSGHGYGFHGLFVGLANLSGDLRFRSGDHALVIDGSDLSLMHARLNQRAYLQGFVISVLCRARPNTALH